MGTSVSFLAVPLKFTSIIFTIIIPPATIFLIPLYSLLTCHIFMNDEYIDDQNSRRRTHITNDFHYRVECFYAVIDQQILAINDRFNEVNSELLTCIANLSPSDGFVDFDNSKLIQLTYFYLNDLFSNEFLYLESQLETYIMDVRSDDRFNELKGLEDLTSKLVTKKNFAYPLVYQLLKFALILPVSTSVERCLSTMNIIENQLRNRIGDHILNDCLVCFVDKE